MLAPRVFIFESDKTYARQLELAFQERGALATVYEDAQLGMAALSEQAPHLCIISAELPKMSGFSVCNRIKKDETSSRSAVVITSSESNDETFDQHKRLRTRAEAYVHKPMDASELATRSLALLELELDAAEFHADDDVTDVIAKGARPSMRGFNIDLNPDMTSDGHAAAPDSSVAASRPVSSRSIDPGPAAMRDANFASLQRLNAELAERLRKAEGERDKLVRELEDHRARPAAPSVRPPPPNSAKDVLDAREALHKKDTELLAVREQLAAKDREVLSLEEQLIAGDRASLHANEALQQAADRHEALEREVEEVKAHAAAELVHLRDERDAAVVGIKDLQQRLLGLEEAHRQRTEQMGKEVERLRAERKMLRENARQLMAVLTAVRDAGDRFSAVFSEEPSA